MDCLINPDRDNDKDEKTTQPSKAKLKKRPGKEKMIKFQIPTHASSSISISLTQAIKYLSLMRDSQRQVQKIGMQEADPSDSCSNARREEKKPVVPFVHSTEEIL